MHSMPPASMTLRSPSLIAWAAIIAVFIPLAQTLLMVVDGVSGPISHPRATCLAGA